MQLIDASFIILSLLTVAIFIIIHYVLKIKLLSQMQKIFTLVLGSIFTLCFGLIIEKIVYINFGIDPIYFEPFVYMGTCTFPVFFYLFSCSFVNTKVIFTKKHFLLFIIPIITILLVATNDLHSLFYVNFSLDIGMEEWTYGPYFNVHSIYTYTLLFIGLLKLVTYSFKNSGFFSKQSILIVSGCLFPLVVNILGTFGIFPMTAYVTPICFTIAIICISLAIFKFNFLSVTPIALQRIVDRMSDSYIVLNENNLITDFNIPFLSTFRLKEQEIRNISIFDWSSGIYHTKLKEALETVSVSPKTISFEIYVDNIEKYFNVEISSIVNNEMFLGTLILFKDITQHTQDLQTIKSNQDLLIEKERFASLGQMIGGIAHNLKTPIMSIAGAAEALIDLVKEYEISIGDPEVTNDDHHEIAKDMSSWISKIRTHTAYMSDVITAVKGQAVQTTDSVAAEFTVEELVKRVNILMKHELKHSLTELEVKLKINEDFTIHGDVNCLVQVINNLISNAIQSYNGEPDNKIDFIIEKTKDSIILSIKDYGCGMTTEVQDKLFKGMITTKGKNGTGLGLFMSYSNIRAHFNGNLTFESELNKGTTFSIILPRS